MSPYSIQLNPASFDEADNCLDQTGEITKIKQLARVLSRPGAYAQFLQASYRKHHSLQKIPTLGWYTLSAIHMAGPNSH